MGVHKEGEGTCVGGTGGAGVPVNLDGATGIGGGDVSSQLGIGTTVETRVGRTLDRAICVDLTNDRVDGRGGPNSIALVIFAVDVDLANIAVG